MNPADEKNPRAQTPSLLGRVLAIDYGTVRLGLAISDVERRWANPYENYTRRTPELDAQYLRDVASEERVTQLVVGLPIHLDGRESEKSRESRQFAAWVGEVTGLPVALFDERFTTAEAEQHLRASKLSRQKRQQRRDMVAACLLLNAYLESSRHDHAHDPPGALDDPSE